MEPPVIEATSQTALSWFTLIVQIAFDSALPNPFVCAGFAPNDGHQYQAKHPEELIGVQTWLT
jgi:hypothetical protein